MERKIHKRDPLKCFKHTCFILSLFVQAFHYNMLYRVLFFIKYYVLIKRTINDFQLNQKKQPRRLKILCLATLVSRVNIFVEIEPITLSGIDPEIMRALVNRTHTSHHLSSMLQPFVNPFFVKSYCVL